MKNNKGFTLIELLVVIAIIGILSSVVLASLTTARSKGSDAAITAELSSMRAQAELYYSTSNSYHTSTETGCTTALFGSSTPGLLALTQDLIKKENSDTTKYYCSSNGTSWVVAASTSASSWCVDSNGKSASTSRASATSCL